MAESLADSMAKKLNALAQRLHAARLAHLGEAYSILRNETKRNEIYGRERKNAY